MKTHGSSENLLNDIVSRLFYMTSFKEQHIWIKYCKEKIRSEKRIVEEIQIREKNC